MLSLIFCNTYLYIMQDVQISVLYQQAKTQLGPMFVLLWQPNLGSPTTSAVGPRLQKKWAAQAHKPKQSSTLAQFGHVGWDAVDGTAQIMEICS
jgi:hypothetical protein